MVNLVPLHSVLVELHIGMITLAVVCVLATAIAKSQSKIQSDDNEESGISWPSNSFVGNIGRYTEPTAYVAGIFGVIGLISSAITGFFIWSIDQLTAFAIGPNKVAFSIFALIHDSGLTEFHIFQSPFCHQ